VASLTTDDGGMAHVFDAEFGSNHHANMTTALEYACRKMPPDRDNPAIRKHVADAIIAVSKNNQTSLGALTDTGLEVINVFLFPPQRPWLKALGI
jgi:hypothetical protein